MNGNALGIGKRITQFEKSDIGVLSHQLTEETDMGRHLSAARRACLAPCVCATNRWPL